MRIILFAIFTTLLTGCAFQSPMVASPTGDGKYWILTQPLEYEQPKTKQKFVVPRGFVTDLASVPRLFWSVFPACGRYTPAAVLHDFLYWQQPKECDKNCADTLLLVAMEEANVDTFSSKAIYAGVHFGGQTAWNQNKAEKAAGAIRFVPEQFMGFGPYDTWEQIENRIRNGNKK